MKRLIAFVLIAAVSTFVAAAADTPSSPSPSLPELRHDGAFGFPQKDATVLCDRPDLRFSVWNNHEYLFAQAVVWNDNDESLGKTEDNREIGDWSVLMLSVGAEGKVTPNADRDYSLNPWPTMSGLYYQVRLSDRSTTGLEKDSKGRGAIRYVELSGGNRVRVDTYLIPIPEIARQVGDRIRLCYWGHSPKPLLTVNSAGYEHGGKDYYSSQIPRSKYDGYVLSQGGEIDVTEVPEGRNDISLSHQKTVPMPKVGEAAPEISAKEWINHSGPLTLASLRGKVAVVEFWATWCGPCVEGMPRLKELQRKYAGKNFELLSLVEEGHQTMDRFLAKRHVEYPVGLESSSLQDYGISSIPHAFVIDQRGKIIWEGHSASPEMDEAISTAMRENK